MLITKIAYIIWAKPGVIRRKHMYNATWFSACSSTYIQADRQMYRHRGDQLTLTLNQPSNVRILSLKYCYFL